MKRPTKKKMRRVRKHTTYRARVQRLVRDLGAKRAAKKLRVSTSTVRDYAAGRRKVPAERRKRIATAHASTPSEKKKRPAPSPRKPTTPTRKRPVTRPAKPSRPKPRPKPKKRPKPRPRITAAVLADLERAHTRHHTTLDLGTCPRWGWGGRPANPKAEHDGGSFALRTESLVSSGQTLASTMATVRREVSAPIAKTYSLSFVIVARLGDDLGADGSNRDTVGTGADELVFIFDKLTGEYPSPRDAYAALENRLEKYRRKGAAAFYLESVNLHAHI